MFMPKFRMVAGILNAATLINAPHEPKAVIETADIIGRISDMRDICSIGEALIRQAHYEICGEWLRSAGQYRQTVVRINDEVLDWYQVGADMARLHPFIIPPVWVDGRQALEEWYTAFQRIHPFEDGNGRVGGAIIAGMSLAMFDMLLIPDGV